MSFNECFEAFMLGQRLRPGLMGVRPPTVALAKEQKWYKGITDKTTITSIQTLNSYMSTGDEIESWIADEYDSGTIMCYVIGTKLIITGDGSGKIVANAESSSCFRDFTAVTTIDLTNLDTSKVTNMGQMFHSCSSLKTLDLTGFNTSKVTYMRAMFYGCQSLTSLDLRNCNTSKSTDMGYMFGDCSSLTSLNLANFDTSNVDEMGSMFENCSSLETLDLTSFDTSKLTSVGGMFGDCSSLKTIYVSDGWDITNASGKYSMFSNCGVSSVTYV